MNPSLIIKSLLIFSAFSGLGIIIFFAADDSIKNKPTEESYLKSDYYETTKKSYEDAMIYFDNNDKKIQLESMLVMPMFGLILSVSYYILNVKGIWNKK